MMFRGSTGYQDFDLFSTFVASEGIRVDLHACLSICVRAFIDHAFMTHIHISTGCAFFNIHKTMVLVPFVPRFPEFWVLSFVQDLFKHWVISFLFLSSIHWGCHVFFLFTYNMTLHDFTSFFLGISSPSQLSQMVDTMTSRAVAGEMQPPKARPVECSHETQTL